MHPQDYQRGLADLLEMDRAVKHAKQYGYEHGDNTLVMVTADHSQAYDVYGSVDIEYGKDLPERDPNDDSQFLLKQAIGVYNQAGFFDLVVDPATGKPDRWNGRFVLAQGKVDGPMRRENFSLVEHPESGTNPLTRAPAVEDKNLTQALGSTTFVANPKDGEHGIDVHGLLPGNSESSVHSMADVPLYCHGPAQGACGRTMDNTELFFVIAQAFGL